MIIESIEVKNFRCLREVFTPLAEFTTIIGENNAGKSTLLEALIIFIQGTKLKKSDFYDPDQEIMIKICLDQVNEETLDALVPEHKARILELVREQKLILVRRYSTDGTTSIKCIKAVPGEMRLKSSIIDETFKGSTGGQIKSLLEENYPEVAPRLDKLTQGRAKELIAEHIAALPPEAFEDEESALPTGIDNSVKNLFPVPVYIPAVKELSDDIKTKEGTTFGKLLSILLNVIESQLVEAEETFAGLNQKLNRVIKEDGTYADNRLDEVKEIENLMGQFVQENFPSTKINIVIPPPEIKTVLSSAKIMVNDGIEDVIDTKGDGLKRAVTFAILRTYVTLGAKPEWQREGQRTLPKDRYLFLFEEPELYLYPTAQRILFDALQQISRTHQVIISTHSPNFLSPETMGTFIKMSKRIDETGRPPYSKALPINLKDLSMRDQFQLICFENNNAAFFSERVVFVEGDSDHITLSHIAKILNSTWDFSKGKVSIVRVNGKGSIARYQNFFNKFEVQTFIISDLDVLIRDFDKLGLDGQFDTERQRLLNAIDKIIQEEEMSTEPNAERVKKTITRLGWREQWSNAKAAVMKVQRGEVLTEDEIKVFDNLFEAELEEPRLRVLKYHPDIQEAKLNLISGIYSNDVFILSRGSLEDYYPNGVTGSDKPSKAQDYCRKVTSPEQLTQTCQTYADPASGAIFTEFEAAFSRVFAGLQLT